MLLCICNLTPYVTHKWAEAFGLVVMHWVPSSPWANGPSIDNITSTEEEEVFVTMTVPPCTHSRQWSSDTQTAGSNTLVSPSAPANVCLYWMKRQAHPRLKKTHHCVSFILSEWSCFINCLFRDSKPTADRLRTEPCLTLYFIISSRALFLFIVPFPVTLLIPLFLFVRALPISFRGGRFWSSWLGYLSLRSSSRK